MTRRRTAVASALSAALEFAAREFAALCPSSAPLVSTRTTQPTVMRTVAIALALLFIVGSSCGCHDGVGPTSGIAELDPATLEAQLAAGKTPVIIDLRSPAGYARGHIPGAVSLQIDQVQAYLHNAVPSRDRTVVTVCAHGNASLAAAATAREGGWRHTYSLRGGMAAWRNGAPLQRGKAARLAPELLAPVVLEVGILEQVVITISGLGFKPTYMVLSLIIIILLWRARERPLRFIRRSMALFLFGEVMCAVNYIFTQGDSNNCELLHGLGMLAMGVLLPWGLAELIDEQVLRYEHPERPCAMARFCRQCWKREKVPCGLHRTFMVVTAALAIVSLMPLTAPLMPLTYHVPVFDSEVHYPVPFVLQVAQFRIYPLIAALGFSLALLLLWWRGRKGLARAKLPFFVGVGFSSFALLRFVLFHAYFRFMPGWADLWEETTELLVILGTLAVLFFFRQQLGVMAFVDRIMSRVFPRWWSPTGVPPTSTAPTGVPPTSTAPTGVPPTSTAPTGAPPPTGKSSAA